jgi:pimeloyl-ACP methyl ester carboxylesterase
MKVLKILGITLLVILLILAIAPFLIPIPKLKDVQAVEELADPDSQFMQVNGIKVHYKIHGSGEPVMILLHGFGASTFSWREVIQPLSKLGTVIAYDRPAFGLTERPMPEEWQGENPYTLPSQDDLLLGLMDQLDIQKAILVGNSAGGTVAVYTALQHPGRVQSLVLVDAAIYQSGGANALLRSIFKLPQVDRLGPLFVRKIRDWGMNMLNSAWYDPSKITPEITAGYRKPLLAENWDRALWELTKAQGDAGLASQLDRLTLPVLVITGDDDRIVPTQNSIQLQADLPDAQLVVIQDCGHVPQEECPQEFLNAVTKFISN